MLFEMIVMISQSGQTRQTSHQISEVNVEHCLLTFSSSLTRALDVRKRSRVFALSLERSGICVGSKII